MKENYQLVEELLGSKEGLCPTSFLVVDCVLLTTWEEHVSLFRLSECGLEGSTATTTITKTTKSLQGILSMNHDFFIWICCTAGPVIFALDGIMIGGKETK